MHFPLSQFFLLIALIFVTAIPASGKNEATEGCPPKLLKQAVVKKLAVLRRLDRKYFAAMPEYRLWPMDQVTWKDISVGAHQEFERGYPFSGAAQRLGALYDGGDPVVREALEFGFRVVAKKAFPGDTADRSFVYPPEDLADVYVAAYQKAIALVEAGKIGYDDLVLPGIEFTVRDDAPVVLGSAKRPSVLCVRPGIDAWPDPKVFQLRNHTHSHDAFYALARQGCLPLPFFTGLEHDVVGHLVDLFTTPAQMARWRRYGAQREVWKKEGNAAELERAALRSYFLAEFFSLPDVGKRDLIVPLLQTVKASALTRTQVLNEFKKMPFAEVTPLSRALVEKADGLLLRYGGGLRDSHNPRFFFQQPFAVSLAVRIRLGLGDLPTFPADYPIPSEGLHAKRLQLRLLLGMAGDSPVLREERDSRMDSIIPVTLPRQEISMAQRDQLILEYTAEMVAAFRMALETNITAAQIYREGGVEMPATDTLTFKYLKAHIPPGTVLYRAFQLQRGITVPVNK